MSYIGHRHNGGYGAGALAPLPVRVTTPAHGRVIPPVRRAPVRPLRAPTRAAQISHPLALPLSLAALLLL